MRILILGLDGAGKTTILYRLQAGEVLIIIDQFCSSWNHPFRWWQRSRLLGSMLRRWHTRTSSSKFGTLEDRPAFDLTGGAIIPTPMRSYTLSIAQTGAAQYCGSIVCYPRNRSDWSLVYSGAIVAGRKWKCWMGQYYWPSGDWWLIKSIEFSTFVDKEFWKILNSDCIRDRVGISKTELVSMLEEEELKDAVLVVLANKQVFSCEQESRIFSWQIIL